MNLTLEDVIGIVKHKQKELLDYIKNIIRIKKTEKFCRQKMPAKKSAGILSRKLRTIMN